MEKGFKRLLGQRVYLLAPEVKTEKIHLSDKAKKEIAAERMKGFMRLKVYAVGEGVRNESGIGFLPVNEGDEVLVGDMALANAPIIHLDNGVSVILVSYYDIVHIW